MSNKTYHITLNGTLIGKSLLESADPPMGVVFGIINFLSEDFDYEFFKNYARDNNIAFEAHPDKKLITTKNIPLLKVLSDDGIEIRGLSTYIEGMDGEDYVINIIGIPYPFYGEQFPHHVECYYKQFEE